MLRVGLITFHRAINFGAVLQTYALQKTFCARGVDCQVIDFRCKAIENYYKPFLIHKSSIFSIPKQFVKALAAYRGRKRKKEKVKNFVSKYLNLSQPYEENLNVLNSQYDVFVTGSDQVFNADITGKDAITYFLSFADKSRYSYAASFGKDYVANKDKVKIKKELEKFRSISVREESAARIVKDITGRTAQVNIDPVLLLSAEEWKNMESKPAWLAGQYILVYNMLSSDLLYSVAEQMRKKYNLRVIFVNNKGIKLKARYSNFSYRDDISPEEFLWLIDHADYVLSSSFHGTVFSILFHKRFLSILPHGESKNTRIESLLQITDLEKCMHLDRFEFETIENSIDWGRVDCLVHDSRNISLIYIDEIISGK